MKGFEHLDVVLLWLKIYHIANLPPVPMSMPQNFSETQFIFIIAIFFFTLVCSETIPQIIVLGVLRWNSPGINVWRSHWECLCHFNKEKKQHTYKSFSDFPQIQRLNSVSVIISLWT